MFLRPHHLQSADRHWTETLALGGQWDNPYNYGLQAIEISQESIANFQFQVNLCHARLRDGTLVTIEPGEQSDRIDMREALVGQQQAMISLQEAFAANNVVRVYLAVPRLKLGGPNVGEAGETAPIRYRHELRSVPDENAGGNDQEIALRAVNVRLLLSTEDRSGYECLPIAQVQRASDASPQPTLDPQYFPPMVCVEAWNTLARDVVRAIYDLIGKKIEVLAEQVQNRRIGFESQEPGDLDRLVMLSSLNEAYITLGVLTFARGVHPWVAYRELCRIVGRIAIFGEGRRVPEAPRYDHDELAPIFYWVKQQIESLLSRVRDYEYEQVYFEGAGRGMQVTLDTRWLSSDWQWFVGVKRSNITAKECETLLTERFLAWKLASARQVERIFQTRAEGLLLAPLERPPRALPPRDWMYFEVSRGNASWRDVQETGTLAMRFQEHFIGNLDTLTGQKQLVVRIGNGRMATLEFALFAVPMHA
jgi:type VI secretion system protein ImpJ